MLLILARDRWSEALGGPQLAHHRAGVVFGDPEPFRESNHGSTTSVRSQKLPSANSFSMSMSRAWLAPNFFRR